MFLASVHSQAADAVERSQRIVALREQYRSAAAAIHSSNAVLLVDLVCETPIVSARLVEDRLGVTRPTALKLLRQLEAVGVLEERALGQRGQRRYQARELMDAVMEERADAPA
jgi:GTP-sensing pleiotropic transcriptional regulator CodY